MARRDVLAELEQALEVAVTYGKPILHWAYIPAVIAVGMLFTKPTPTFGQLFFLA
eukprot:CAMPEP_0119104636 /NCGR_PEP_ID=MMETSP1180-20130426/2801_1 /TAXON_ID=3052 ORGANISM="Chlamydomonas cf sp, Strain CCMP681" /NCGR_SAMPLE_ID=MMETSP1180 /ASSEMBLY_ACC=CAM_ASM_000741 /LENGTH=54 /DNA_ID=CAMNT_0007089455 /DNA_START=114 /DNA_END=278 /DNA_ORIENTATION=+